MTLHLLFTQSFIKLCAAFSVRLVAAGLGKADIIAAFASAARHNTSFNDELVHKGAISEAALYRLWAEETGLTYDDAPDAGEVLLRPFDGPARLSSIRHILIAGSKGQSLLYMAPDLRELAMLKFYLRQYPEMRERLRLCPPSVLVALLHNRYGKAAAGRAQKMTPAHLSASLVLNGWQGFCFAGLLIGLLWMFLTEGGSRLAFLYWGMTLFFFACVTIRLLAAWNARPLHIRPLAPYRLHDLPVYTVLVPLYKEAGIVRQLIQALSALNWPVAKLDIKLICEADDSETLAALSRHKLPAQFEVLKVPSIGPRTKPKALNYALQFARGEYLVVYDAEDRPHRDQLLEAWQAFRRGGSDLACLQAPLVIGNFSCNYLTRYFSFEYAGLFRGLLPWLSRRGAVMPLGGTSNHLRRKVLQKVGGWDSYNVTEDADLGMRLARFGYRVDVINRPTTEDAPENYKDWKTQRTRWFKGWMQTWLVHMRSPVQTCRQLGAARFSLYLLYTTGLLLSALLHPFMLVSLIWGVALTISGYHDQSVVAAISFNGLNLLTAYLSFHLLCQKTLRYEEKRRYFYLWGVPLYWLLLSVASWRAFYQMFTAPHHWEKTPHFPSRIESGLKHVEDDRRTVQTLPAHYAQEGLIIRPDCHKTAI